MSRIGLSPVKLDQGVQIIKSEESLVIKGPKGEIILSVPSAVRITEKDGFMYVETEVKSKSGKALHGNVRSLLANAIVGVTSGFTKTLELTGVGYRAVLNGNNLVLTVGFTHPVIIEPPSGITFSIVEGKILVTGIDKQKVGQIASDIRAVKKPEPYKGKGIKYSGEHIRRKAGKTAKAVGGAK